MHVRCFPWSCYFETTPTLYDSIMYACSLSGGDSGHMLPVNYILDIPHDPCVKRPVTMAILTG